MRLFYFDEEIKAWESNMNFVPVIRKLEKIFSETEDLNVLSTIIGCSWLYYIEGQVKQIPVDYDSEYFESKWKEYIEIGLNKYKDSDIISFIIAYTLNLHWFLLGSKYEYLDEKLFRNVNMLTKDAKLNALNNYFLTNTFDKLENPDTICKDLFPTESLLDRYFKEILNMSTKP